MGRQWRHEHEKQQPSGSDFHDDPPSLAAQGRVNREVGASSRGEGGGLARGWVATLSADSIPVALTISRLTTRIIGLTRGRAVQQGTIPLNLHPVLTWVLMEGVPSI